MAGSGVAVLLYLNIMLLMGLFLRHFAKRISAFIPYTVLLLAIGVALGIAGHELACGGSACGDDSSSSSSSSGSSSGSAAASGSGSGSSNATASGSSDDPWASIYVRPKSDFVMAIQAIAGMDPHLLLYVFLPALLFESANAIDFHVFDKVKGKTVTLAFPCMILGERVCRHQYEHSLIRHSRGPKRARLMPCMSQATRMALIQTSQPQGCAPDLPQPDLVSSHLLPPLALVTPFDPEPLCTRTSAQSWQPSLRSIAHAQARPCLAPRFGHDGGHRAPCLPGLVMGPRAAVGHNHLSHRPRRGRRHAPRARREGVALDNDRGGVVAQ